MPVEWMSMCLIIYVLNPKLCLFIYVQRAFNLKVGNDLVLTYWSFFWVVGFNIGKCQAYHIFYIILCTSLIKVGPIVLVGSTFIREVIHNVV